MTALAALDSWYTLMWIGQRGLGGEVNPLIKTFFQAGLGTAWWVTNILTTFLGAVFLGSCVITLPMRGRNYAVLGISLLATLRVFLAVYHLIQFYNILEVTWILWLTSVATFLITRRVLSEGKLLDLDMASRSLRELYSELSTLLVMSRIAKPRTASARPSVEPARVSEPPRERRSALRNWRLIVWVAVIILAPIIALSLIQIMLQASGVLELPAWMRSLGIVSEEQGRLFLIAFITIFLTIAISVYAVVAVFEILSAEPKRKRRFASL